MAEKKIGGPIHVVGFAHYKKQDNFVLYLLNNKCDFVTHLDKYLTSFTVHSFFDQKSSSLLDYIPGVCYTDMDKVKEFLVIPNLDTSKYKFEDRPGDPSKHKSIQLMDIKSYEQSIMHKAVLKAVEANEKERKSFKLSSI